MKLFLSIVIKFLLLTKLIYSSVGFASLHEARKLTEMLMDFHKNNNEILLKLSTTNEEYDTIIEKFNKNIQHYKVVLASISDCLEGKKSENELLSEIFLDRISLLNKVYNQNKALKKALKDKLNGREYKEESLCGWIETDPDRLEKLKTYSPHYDPKTDRGKYNLQVARGNIDQYQMENRIIFELVHGIGQARMSDKNRMWLRCLVSLHPFLAGKTEDPGFPDQALRYSMNEFKNKKSESRSESKDDDYKLCTHYMIEKVTVPVKIRTPEEPDSKTSHRNMTRYEIFGFNIVSYENYRRNFPNAPFLPSLDFLWPEEIKEEIKEVIALQADRPLDLHPTTGDDLSTANEPPQAEPGEDSKAEEPSDSTTSQYRENIELEPQVRSTAVDLPAVSQLCDPAIQYPEFIPPSGIRKIHPQYFNQTSCSSTARVPQETESLIKTLKARDQEWLKNLFNHEFNLVDYRDFERIWLHLNGDDSIQAPGKGGSHRRLYNREKIVVGSIFTHGDSQQYARPYLNYLRANFSAIGITPDELI